MPIRRCCEHPIKHANSACVPKGIRVVSFQLSIFLVSRYSTTSNRIRWLCSRCHAFESKEMLDCQDVSVSDKGNSSDDEAMMTESPDNGCTSNGDIVQQESSDSDPEEEEEEEKENDSLMDSGFMPESKESDRSSTDMDGESTDCEPMNEEADDVPYKIEYEKEKAAEKLSTVFDLFKISPIHDK